MTGTGSDAGGQGVPQQPQRLLVAPLDRGVGHLEAGHLDPAGVVALDHRAIDGRPSVSATSWAQALASSRRSLPTASTRATAAAGADPTPGCLNSGLHEGAPCRSPTSRPCSRRRTAPAARAASSSDLPLTPPGCASTSTTSSPGSASRSQLVGDRLGGVRHVRATTITGVPPNRDGLASPVTRPGSRPTARRSCTSASGSADPHGGDRGRTARSRQQRPRGR